MNSQHLRLKWHFEKLDKYGPRPNCKRRPFTSFCFVFRFQKSFVLFQSVCLCLSRGKEVAARNPAIAHCKTAWEFGGIAASPLPAMPSCPPIAGDIRRRRWLSHARQLVPGLPLPQARRSREITPLARLWVNAHRIAAYSCPPDRRWLMPAGSPLTQAHRIGADSCPLAAAIPSPVDLVHLLWPGVLFLSRVVPTGTF